MFSRRPPSRRAGEPRGGSGRGTAARCQDARVLDWRPAERKEAESRYAGAFERARAWALERHSEIQQAREEAREVAERLLRQPPRRRDLLMRNHPRYSGWRLASVLLDEVDGWAGRTGDRWAVATVAAGLVRSIGADDGATACDVAGRGLRILAELQLDAGDLAAAGHSLAEARRRLRHGSGDPLARARLLETTGILLAARGRRRGEAFLAGAARLYSDLSESAGEGRARILGALYVLGGEVDPAVAPRAALVAGAASEEPSAARVRGALDELRFGLDLLDPAEDLELYRAASRRLSEVTGFGLAGVGVATTPPYLSPPPGPALGLEGRVAGKGGSAPEGSAAPT